MNILITLSWLKEYLQTKASASKIAECLSLCGASVEKLTKSGQDWVYEIEITTNRVDMMSVAGIARELSTILPQFSIKANLKKDPYKIYKKIEAKTPKLTKSKPLKVLIKNAKLCPRFTAIILDNITVKPAPKKISQRLEISGIRSLNNIIDISNYLMRELGQPVHIFDYDKISNATMILRESRKNEKLITLDGKKHLLPGKDIVIEDGQKRLIDLCGIMGGQNSAIDQNSKRIVLFVQTYDPVHIRKTSMKLAHRTEAAQLFEKKTDPNLVMPTLIYGVELLQKYANAKIASKIYDIYPHPNNPKNVLISLQFIKERLGVSLQLTKVKKILLGLGFKVAINKKSILTVSIPSWRSDDIKIPEDIVEEIARIYGYHRLPSQLPSGYLPTLPPQSFIWEKEAKHLLKDLGYSEVYTYSLTSKKMLQKFLLDSKAHLKLANPLAKEWLYLRTSLLPSMLAVATANQSIEENLKFFELAKVYLYKANDLPSEVERLSFISCQGYLKIKGDLESLFEQMNIEVEFIAHEKITQLATGVSAVIFAKKDNTVLGVIGKLKKSIQSNFKLKKDIFLVDLNFDKLKKLAKSYRLFKPIAQYPPIIERLTFENPDKIYAGKIIKTAKNSHHLVSMVSIVDTFRKRISLEIKYQSPKRSLRDKEIGKIRKLLVKNLEKLGLKLHGKLI